MDSRQACYSLGHANENSISVKSLFEPIYQLFGLSGQLTNSKFHYIVPSQREEDVWIFHVH